MWVRISDHQLENLDDMKRVSVSQEGNSIAVLMTRKNDENVLISTANSREEVTYILKHIFEGIKEGLTVLDMQLVRHEFRNLKHGKR